MAEQKKYKLTSMSANFTPLRVHAYVFVGKGNNVTPMSFTPDQIGHLEIKDTQRTNIHLLDGTNITVDLSEDTVFQKIYRHNFKEGDLINLLPFTNGIPEKHKKLCDDFNIKAIHPHSFVFFAHFVTKENTKEFHQGAFLSQHASFLHTELSKNAIEIKVTKGTQTYEPVYALISPEDFMDAQNQMKKEGHRVMDVLDKTCLHGGVKMSNKKFTL